MSVLTPTKVQVDSVWGRPNRISSTVGAVSLFDRTPSKCALFALGEEFLYVSSAFDSGLISLNTELLLIVDTVEIEQQLRSFCLSRGFTSFGIVVSKLEHINLEEGLCERKLDYVLIKSGQTGEKLCKFLSDLHRFVEEKAHIVVECIVGGRTPNPLVFAAYESLSATISGRPSRYLDTYTYLINNLQRCGARRLFRSKPVLPQWEISNILLVAALSWWMDVSFVHSEEFRDREVKLLTRFKVTRIRQTVGKMSFILRDLFYDISKKRRQAKNRRKRDRQSSKV